MKPLIISPFGEHPLLMPIAKQLGAEVGVVTHRHFPDGESFVKFENSLQGRDLVILASLDYPNNKILPLLFLAETARELGVKRIGLCAPYLSYMRQDKRFHPGEGVTSVYFAKLLSHYVDWLVTVDPHLHRHYDLNEIYSIPSTVLHAASTISQWILDNINNPVLIGPDSESEQWVRDVAESAQAPYLILEKKRQGDYDVEVSEPAIKPYLTCTPVLVDDIISTASTMMKTIEHVTAAKMNPPVCIGVHAVFAESAYDALLAAGVSDVVSCNTINHPSNKINLSNELLSGIQNQLVK